VFYNSNGLRIPDFLKKILEIPFFYDLMQNLSGHNRTTKEIVINMLKKNPQHAVIDLGCGSGNVTNLVGPNQEYIGIDIHGPYIAKAKENFPDRKFLEGSILELSKKISCSPEPTLFLALGLFHHLSDLEVGILIKEIKNIRPNFTIASLDPCFCQNQTTLSRFLANSDRGKFVRSDQNLISLLSQHSLKAKNYEVSSKYMRTRMYILIAEWIELVKP
jgi:trans-aconitate methyltransferase